LYGACTEVVQSLYGACRENPYKLCAGARWARKENPLPSDLNRHMVLQSKKRTLACSHASTTQAALHKLVNCAGIPQDAAKAAIGKHDRGQQWNGTRE
jgi:hypothetical protein